MTLIVFLETTEVVVTIEGGLGMRINTILKNGNVLTGSQASPDGKVVGVWHCQNLLHDIGVNNGACSLAQ